ncbi:hypothetical protein [Crocinitomix catalasitica]|uniref:hypothetical protein n=1 Tax=Crocinitomix catalasitica TaxID=184607 RepID=UPI000480B0A6|nr:hypothetical protein [Crocinitomix catalasitica]
MKSSLLLAVIIASFQFACQNEPNVTLIPLNNDTLLWNKTTLETKAQSHLDSSNWDITMLQQDIENYKNYKEIFDSYPLRKTPFPVAEYEYAVASNSFILEIDSHIFKVVTVGEYENFDSDSIINQLTLIVLTEDKEADESTLVESRNAPYLTATGYFKFEQHQYDWVFTGSPDGYANLLINMKLFDLRFGRTVVIIPHSDLSFRYLQINDSPNNYTNWEAFKSKLILDEQINSALKVVK